MSTDIAPPADGTEVRLNGGMPGTYEGQPAIVRHCHPRSGHSNLPRLVWLECEVIWSHGTADGFWAGRGEYRPATEEWRNGRLVDSALSEGVCVHLVGLTPGMWCGSCNTHPDHPDRRNTPDKEQ